jgi:glycosyltransferase involved in cell wall biosynthesis
MFVPNGANSKLKTQNSKLKTQNSKLKTPPPSRLMLFELSADGHHPGYIQHLVRYWREEKLPGQFEVVVSPEFLEQHPDVVEQAGDRPQTGITFRAIELEEVAALSSRRSGRTRAIRAFQEWRLIQRYAQHLKADHCFIPYFDTRQLPLALGATLPCPFSSIYFRPTFHYPTLIDAVSSRRDRWQQWRGKLILKRVLANSQLQTLFCLDPFVVKHLQQFHHSVNAVPLPDPVQIYPQPIAVAHTLKQTLGIDAHRTVFLLFGALEGRKGIHQLLQAISQLADDRAQQLCLLLVGPIHAEEKSQVESQISALQQRLPVQILCVNQFVKDSDIQPYFQLADVILAPYQRHVGMSAILVRAAAAQKPVLASDYGLMGEITRRYELGLTVDSTQPSALAEGLTRLLQTSLTQVGNRAQMQAFAEQNSAQRFATQIFQTIWTGHLQTV